jgi:hypothetical protein
MLLTHAVDLPKKRQTSWRERKLTFKPSSTRCALRSEELEHQFQVIVDCKDEQLALIEKLEKQKYVCRALIL